jgi:hypothetical protein
MAASPAGLAQTLAPLNSCRYPHHWLPAGFRQADRHCSSAHPDNTPYYQGCPCAVEICVCVCEGERVREGEGEREREGGPCCVSSLPLKSHRKVAASHHPSPLGMQFRLQEVYAFEGLTRPMMPSLPQRIATAHTKFRPFCLPGALPQTVGPRMSSRQVSRKGRRFAKLDQGTDAPAERPDPFQRTGVHWKSPPFPHQPRAGDTSPPSLHFGCEGVQPLARPR